MRNQISSKKRKKIIRIFAEQQDNQIESKLSPKQVCTQNFVFGKPEQNQQAIQSLRRALKQVEKICSSEKQTRIALQEKVDKLFLHSIGREKQYQKLLQQTVPFITNGSHFVIKTDSLSQVQNKLLQFFKNTNEIAQTNMLNRNKQIEGIMDRKVNHITSQMEAELNRNRHKVTLDSETIRQEINQIIRLSTDIINENYKFKKQNERLLFTNNILREEKQLLIVELIEKKNVITKLYGNLKQNYERDNNLEKQVSVLKYQLKMQESNRTNHKQQKIETGPKIIQWSTIKSRSIPVIPKQKHLSPQKLSDNKITIDSHQNLKTSSIAKRHRSNEPKGISSTLDIHKDPSPRTKYEQQNRFYTTIKSQISNHQTIGLMSNLKESLRLQKHKNSELSKKVKQYQVYQNQMDNMLKSIFIDFSGKYLLEQDNNNQQIWKIMKNSGKIYHMIKEIGRRLLSSSNPAVNCGLEDLNRLMEEFKEEIQVQ